MAVMSPPCTTGVPMSLEGMVQDGHLLLLPCVSVSLRVLIHNSCQLLQGPAIVITEPKLLWTTVLKRCIDFGRAHSCSTAADGAAMLSSNLHFV